MASFSPTPSRNFDVFLSFSGKDTRNTFTSHLYDALKDRGIDAFKDEKLREGNDLTKLFEIIQNSKMTLIVISRNYANSHWCLDELVKILECKRDNDQEVVPIFHNVDKKEVEIQKQSFETTFPQYAQRAQTWRDALTDAFGIRGHVFPGKRTESQIVKDVANEVLETISLRSAGDSRNLVGIESRRKDLEKLLCFDDLESVRVVGIVGMPGIGKTTIANDIYKRKRRNFDACCFVTIEWGEKVESLQDRFLSHLFGIDRPNTGDRRVAFDVYKNMACNKKVLIVVDDFSEKYQIEHLIGDPELYKGGSRIIITSADKKLIEKVVKADKTYELPPLNGREALQLFSLHAFPYLSEPPEEFMDLTNMILDYAKGIPLALEVLGCDLTRKDISRWKHKLEDLESWRDEKIQALLKISYNALNKKQKDVFLDIACFFRSENADYVRSLLDSPGNASDDDPLGDLIDKYLLTISDNRLQMHDLLQTMGKEISLEATSSREAGNRGWLWDPEDIIHVLRHRRGTGEIRGIFLDMSKVEETNLSSKVFKKMWNLRYLKLFNSHCSRGCEAECKFHFSEGLKSLPDTLTYLHWQGYPLANLPQNFDPRKLVDFKLPYSQIEQLWGDKKRAEKLRWIDLSHSQRLNSLSGLSSAQNLEILNLQGCINLGELPPSIECMNKLVYLNLRDCTSLANLPEGVNLECLKTVILSGCSNLMKFPWISKNIEVLHLDGTAIKVIPPCIEELSKLAILNLKFCKMLQDLSDRLYKLTSLQELILSGCSSLESFPDINEDMERLEILLLEGTAIRQMPRTMRLSRLKTFSLSRTDIRSSERRFLPPLSTLRDLYLANCGFDTLPQDVSFMSSLQSLHLSRNNFETLPSGIKDLHHLRWLDLKYCQRLQSLPVLPANLQYLDAHGCVSLLSVASPLTNLMVAERIHSTFIFTNCLKLNQEALDNIVGHAQIKSQLMANASLKHYHRGCVMEPLVDICYPGMEIPLWFDHRRTGSSLKTQLPPHWCDNKFIGFALCAVVSFNDCNDCSNRFSVKCSCKFENDYGYCISFTCTLRSWAEPVVLGNGSRGIRSDHVILSYNSCFHITKCYGEDKVDTCGYTKASLTFRVTDDTPRKLENCKVEKCGLSLFHAPEENNTRLREMWDRIFDQEIHETNMLIHLPVHPPYNQVIVDRD